MRITRGWNALTGVETFRLEIDVTGNSPADALRMVLDESAKVAEAAGPATQAQFEGWTIGWRKPAEQAEKMAASLHVDVDKLRRELTEMRRKYETAVRVGVDSIKDCSRIEGITDKIAERRDRWRQRFDETRAKLDIVINERDEARAQARAARDLAAVRNGIAEELMKTRAERDEARAESAQARRKALTEAADSLERDVKMFDGIFGVGVLHAVGRLRGWAGRVPVSVPNAGVNFEVKPNPTNAPKWQGRPIIEVPDPTPGVEPNTAERVERVFKACGYTNVEGDRDLLAAILAAVEAIRDDLASMGPIR